MATSTSSVPWAARLLAVVAAVGTVVALSSCTPRPDGPELAAEQFLAALAVGDTAAAADLSDRPDAARIALNEAWAGLQAERLDAQIVGSKYTEDTGSIAYRFSWQLPRDRTWTYDGQLNMVRNNGRWQVRWATTGLHPRLGENQRFALRAEQPPRASVHERTGTSVLRPGYRYHYALDARTAGAELMPTARAVVDALRPFDDTLDPQLLAEQASAFGTPLSLITLRQSDHDPVSAAIGSRPGVVITPQTDLVPTDDGFAPALLSQVKQAVFEDLDGTAGWRVVTVNQNGVEVDVLHEVAGDPAPSVTISLDRNVQDAAQGAVNTTGRQAMIVAIRPSTGEILAVAQNAAADAEGPLATTGLFPPGSVFKIVTAGAALDRDMATPNTLLPCPGRIDIAHRRVPNYGGFDLGTVPLSRAFASSCNTTFAELASRMPPRGLTTAAAQYGLGAEYSIEGLKAPVTGSVPPTVNVIERTEDGFGQGKVLASPFGMALVAATVAAGHTPVPKLIDGRDTVVTSDIPPISPEMVHDLRPMMRLVVTNGTADSLQGVGDVRGKTGEAEFAGGSHSWFAGYRGDLAFASLIVGGGSSEYAVRMSKTMLGALPPDYLA